MKSRNAISVSSAAAHLFVIPLKDPIEILIHPVRLILFYLACGMIFHREPINFTYGDTGVDWNGTCHDGKRQSPIHIRTGDAIVFEKAEPIVFINYDMASLEVELREHTIKFDPKLPIDGMMVGIAGGGLRGFYQLNHIHLHWSNSEHTIDDNTYKMEVHLVHFKAPYDNLTVDDVIDEPDGIAVLSVLYELGGVDRVIHNLIENLRRNVTEAELPFIKPKDFLPETTDEYIRYRGSLTTPPCTEVVVWTVFPKPKTITQYQINWLRAKRLSAGTAQPDNFRVRQPVNDRQVSYMEVSYAYANPELPRASGKIVLPTLWLLGTWPVLVRLLGA